MYDINTYVEDITLTYEQINYLLEVLAQHIGITQITGAPFSMDRLTIHNAVSKMLDDKKMLIEKHHEEDNKPKYEHRYAVCSNDSSRSVIQEYDTLNEAWHTYIEYYENDYKRDPQSVGNDYIIYDFKTQEVVTSAMPMFDVEFEWNAEISVNLDGRTVYDIPDWVMESIASSMAYGDTDGYVNDTVGDIEWDDIADWESDHDEEEVNDVL